MICLVGLSKVHETLHSAILVSDDFPEVALVLNLDDLPLEVQLEDVKSAWCLIIFVHDMCVDTETIILAPIIR